MIRRGCLIGVAAALFCLLAPGAHARTSPFAKAVLVGCDRENREAAFEGRVSAIRRAPKMQMRFTLQALTPDSRRWRSVEVATFGEWITAPAGLGRYTYTKTVEDLLAPARYRAVVDFRWRDRRNRTVRTERAISPVCRQPDARPDLVVRSVGRQDDQYVAVVFNRGRMPAGPFAVDFLADASPVGSVEVIGLEPQTPVTVMLPAPPCAPGAPVEAVADPRSEVDEADEENNAFSAPC